MLRRKLLSCRWGNRKLIRIETGEYDPYELGALVTALHTGRVAIVVIHRVIAGIPGS